MTIELTRMPDPTLKWAVIYDAILLLAKREKCSLVTYLDWPGKKPTKGWGETNGVAIGDTPWTDAECDQKLCDAVALYAKEVLNMLTVDPSHHQLGALLVCAYNIGLGGMANSSMVRLHNAKDFNGAARAFALWNKAKDATTGKEVEVDELVSRRAAEAAMYLEPDDGVQSYPTPQVVVPEPTMASSPTVQTSAVAVATGGVALVGTFSSTLAPLASTARDIASSIGVTPVQVLGSIMLATGAVTLYRRFAQRSAGKA